MAQRRKRAPKQPPTGTRMVLLDDRGKGGWIADVMTAHMFDTSRVERYWDGGIVIPSPMSVTMTVREPKYYATTRALLKAAARKPRLRTR
jgi:hypothetical protein